MSEPNTPTSSGAGTETVGLASDLANTIKTHESEQSFNVDDFQAFLTECLSGYKQHQLDELTQATLMDRVDTKFLLPRKMLPIILAQLKDNYSNLVIDGRKIFTYHNQYFDTQGMTFYKEHHNGKANRYKVRIRQYVESDIKFLEVKLKNNKKRTIKTRIELKNQLDQASAQFVYEQSGYELSNLAPVHNSGYQRITLANESQAERITLDFNLWYQSSSDAEPIKLKDAFIAELKQKKQSRSSQFFKLMNRYSYSPLSFSKYCVGCALLSGKGNQNGRSNLQGLKTNRFKPTLIQLNKIER